MIETQAIINNIRQYRIIAILRDMPQDKLLPVADALFAGGIRLIECTFDHTREDAVSANCAMIELLANHMRGRMTVGAGTVLTPAEVRATIDAGGEIIISPNADPAVICAARGAGAVSVPGAFTPTEVVSAYAAGAHFVKIFPAGSLGADYIRAIRAPLKHIPMLAVGGVNPEDMPAYLQAGISGFGIGSPLLPAADIERGDFKAVERRARAFTDAVNHGGI